MAAEDARVARTRADVARAALERADQRGFRCGHARPRRRTRRLLQDHAVHPLAGAHRPDRRWRSRASATCRTTNARGDLRADLIGGTAGVPPGRRRVPAGPRAVRDGAVGVRRARCARSGTRSTPTANADARRCSRSASPALELEAAVSMLAGVVACPSIMFGTLPDDAVIGAAVDIVLRSAG